MSSYYMKESTYRHDFNKQATQYKKPFPSTFHYNGQDMLGQYYRPVQQEGNRMAPQERGYDYRQDGPYTDRGGYQYHDRYPDGSQIDRPGYNRFDDRRNGPDRRYDDMNGPSDRGYDRAPQTDRGNYNDRYERNDRSFSPERQRNDRSFSPERNRYNNPPSTYDPVQAYDRFGNRTTQRDYGHFAHNERAPVDRPHAFRGQVDKEVESFHNKNKQSEPEILEDDDHYIDEMYLRPEERKVRHRNMEYDYDAQQRLPQAIAPQREYISNINRPGRSESGAYLFIRANKNACDQIKLSFQKHKSILKMSGLLKGIARPDRISVTGDFSNWNITGPLVRRGESWYETKGGSKSGEYGTDCIIIVLWFPSVDAAKKWYIYDIDFKIASFPEPHGVEMVILPINYLPSNDIDCNTFVMMEYPGVVNKSALKTYVKDPVEEILTKDRQYEGCEPFVVWTEDPTLGRGQIVSSRSVVAIHRFRSLAQAMEFLNDPRVGRLSRELKDITRGGRSTTSVFQLVDFV